jgi:hypothetical protein
MGNAAAFVCVVFIDTGGDFATVIVYGGKYGVWWADWVMHAN